MRLIGDLYPRWVLTHYITPLFAVGTYRGWNRSDHTDLLTQRVGWGICNGAMYVICPILPISRLLPRLEIEYCKPHLKEDKRYEWAFKEFI
jgi:hypothetical protein